MEFMDIYTTLYKDIHKEIEEELEQRKNKNDNIIIINHIEEYKLDEYLCDDSKCDNLISFDFDIFIEENLKSYEYDNSKIWEQLQVDLPRTNIYVEGKLMKSIEQFMDSFDKITNIIYKSKNIPTILAMICCQSSYAFPYILLSGLYCKSPDLLLASDSKNRDINISFEDGLKISLEANFSITNFVKDEKVSNVHMLMIINTDKKLSFLKAGLLQWNIY